MRIKKVRDGRETNGSTERDSIHIKRIGPKTEP